SILGKAMKGQEIPEMLKTDIGPESKAIQVKNGAAVICALENAHILPLSVPAKRFQFERHIKTLSQRIITTYRLLIAIEHALPNWPLVEYRKKLRRNPYPECDLDRKKEFVKKY
ncbi:MAG: hypothetical protein ACXVMS_18950, partial [Flavisolibacter sp.]